ELLEDAPSEMQRELLNRAVAAGHSPAEVHAFADALRGMSDDEAFDACTIELKGGPDYSVVQLLKAEGDPLFAFTLQGGELSPAEPSHPKLPIAYAPPGAPGRARPRFDETDPKVRRERPRPFDSSDEDGLKRVTAHQRRELGHSADAPSHSRAPAA